MKSFLRVAVIVVGLLVASGTWANQESEKWQHHQSQNDKWIWPSAYRKLELSEISTPNFQSSIYLLQLRIPKAGHPQTLGPSPWPWPVKGLHLVFRLEKRPDPTLVAEEFLARAAKWEAQGVKVEGLQLDYDSPTSKLGFYAQDLKAVQTKLKEYSQKKYSLSITGLSDWLRVDDTKNLFAKNDITVFFQLYRERQAHRAQEQHLAKIQTLRFPFKIGLLPGQELATSTLLSLKKNSYFRGLVTFDGGSRR